LCNGAVDVREDVFFVKRALFEILLQQLIVRFGDEFNEPFARFVDKVAPL
jgi:hypothetical protein